MPIETVVFDLGGVLVDWNPRYLYRTLFDDEAEMEAFMATLMTRDIIRGFDGKGSFTAAVEAHAEANPDHRDTILAFDRRWPECLAGTIPETVEVLHAVKAAGYPLYALTNWPREPWNYALERLDFLDQFDGIVVSGIEEVCKPDPGIYRILLNRYGLAPETTFFTDDAPENIDAARALGIQAEQFTGAAALRAALAAKGVDLGG